MTNTLASGENWLGICDRIVKRCGLKELVKDLGLKKTLLNHQQNGEYSKVIDLYSMISHLPQFEVTDVLYSVGISLKALGRVSEAHDFFKKALDLSANEE